MFTIYNGPMPTTASQLGVSTGTGILTLLQILPTKRCRILEWGVSFAGAAVAAGVEVELLDTAAVFATVTASVDADIHKVDNGSIAASTAGLTLGTAATGYTASAEGTVAATRILMRATSRRPTGSTGRLPRRARQSSATARASGSRQGRACSPSAT